MVDSAASVGELGMVLNDQDRGRFDPVERWRGEPDKFGVASTP